MKDRDVHIKLGILRDGVEDISGVWYNFTLPDIKVCANGFLWNDANKTMSLQLYIMCLRENKSGLDTQYNYVI